MTFVEWKLVLKPERKLSEQEKREVLGLIAESINENRDTDGACEL